MSTLILLKLLVLSIVYCRATDENGVAAVVGQIVDIEVPRCMDPKMWTREPGNTTNEKERHYSKL